MEVGRARGNRDDDPRLPTLSLGLSSVRHIVTRLEAEYARVVTANCLGSEIVKYDPSVDEAYIEYHDFPFDNPKGQVWNRFAVNVGVALSKCIPSVTFANFGVLAVVTGLFAPRMISYLILYPFCRLVFGTLYPAYASYKAVRTKNLKEYVKWMMYWIVFALFTCTETFTDVFLSWFPFYYEVKIVLVLWLLSPATKGSSILYRKFVHPALCRREQEIDEYIAKAKDQGYHTVLNLGTKGVNYATTVIMQTAIKGGGGLVQQLRKSYSLSDLSECEPREERGSDEADDVLAEPRLIRRTVKTGFTTRRSASESNSRSPMYFPEVDVDVRPARSRMDEPDFSHIKSTEDISSGYSSADNSGPLARSGSLGARRVRSARTAVTAIKRPPAAEDNEVTIEELQDDDSIDFANMPPLVNFQSPLFLSHTDPPFIYQYVGDQVKIIQVLGNYPSIDEPDKVEHWDQKQNKEKSDKITTNNEKTIDEDKTMTKDVNDIPIQNQPHECNISTPINNNDHINSEISIQTNNSNSEKYETPDRDYCNIDGIDNNNVKDDETSSLDVQRNDSYSAESDDEASFGTPENSPKSSRKIAKGKYGKNKAPLPPVIIEKNIPEESTTVSEESSNQSTEESFVDVDKSMSSSNLKEEKICEELTNDILAAEEKGNQKGKSTKTNKSHSSSLEKLLQLPSKLAFWHRETKTDDASSSSEDKSQRSSSEKVLVELQNCSDDDFSIDISLKDNNTQFEISDDQISFKDADEFDKEIIAQDVIKKSDALQKVIEAKLESHPEYKLAASHEEIPTTSKSTDV
ncbi:uncharacterized protein [Epargyreus clarus]|uniref:uncharacterized protein isoform X1 n=1 Tax=Epargyreus clarus TaxID=520877 RepID=UPI003C2FF76C